MLKYFIVLIYFTVVINSMMKKEKLILEPTLENLLFSIEKLMVFFSKRYDKINLDGLFGVRALQGEIRRILEKGEHGAYPAVNSIPHVKEKLWNILSIADNMVPHALPEVKKKNEKYFDNFRSLVEKPFRLFEIKPEKITTFDPDALPKSEEDDGFSEEMSDECMASLIGSNGHEKCEVDSCWEKMTKFDTTLYYTTHQVIWLQLAIDVGCQAKLEAKMVRGGGIVELFRKLCTSVVFQMDSLFKNGDVLYRHQDIFLEQGMLCGGMGFMDAVNRTWLKAAMTWQNQKLGCFKDYNPTAYGDYDEFYANMNEKREEWKSRYLLMDSHMGNLCSSHKSAVGVGFYAVYLRLFLDPDFIQSMLWPDLYGPLYATRLLWIRRLKYVGIFISVWVLFLLIFRPRLRYKICSKLQGCRRKNFTNL